MIYETGQQIQRESDGAIFTITLKTNECMCGDKNRQIYQVQRNGTKSKMMIDARYLSMYYSVIDGGN